MNFKNINNIIKKPIDVFNNTNENLITNNFHYPINNTNFLKIIYNINNLNEFSDYINNNHIIIFKDTYIRLLNNCWIELFNDIKNNFDLFIEVNINIFKDLMKKNNINDDLDNDIIYNLTNIIRKLIKKNKKKINYIKKLKERIIINFL